MQVLVTGGAGFIGSNLVHYLCNQRRDWNITVVDSLTYAGNLKNIAALIDQRRVSFSRGDIRDSNAINELFTSHNFDYVFHLAAESHVDRSLYNAGDFVSTNVGGTQNLVSAALSNGVKRFLHISTDEVYGSLGPTGRFVETTPLDPSSPYSASKASSDLMVLAAARTHKLNAIVTRCTNNYGPYHFPEKLIPLFITNALEDQPLPLYGDGLNVRSWLHVRDHCQALLLVAEGGRAGEIYNIGGMHEAEIPNVEVTKLILSYLGKPQSLIKYVQDRPGHDRRYAIDYSKINKELGWKPQIKFEDGLTETISWFSTNREWWKSIKSGDYLKFYEHHYGQSSLSGVSV